MTLKEILAKIAKGEELNEAEKKFLADYDPDKAVNDAAAAARRKAEAEKARLQTELDELKAANDAEKAAAEAAKSAKLTDAQRTEAKITQMSKEINELKAAKEEAEKASARLQRSQAIRDAAKAAGIALAPKTISEKLFFQMLEATVGEVDMADAEQLKTVLETFKNENPGVIAAPGAGSGLNPGEPGKSDTGKNPWNKDSFNLSEQVRMFQAEPDRARTLAAQAGVKLD